MDTYMPGLPGCVNKYIAYMLVYFYASVLLLNF